MRKLGILLVLLLMCTACSSKKKPTVGLMFNLKGAQSSLDEPSCNGTKLALDGSAKIIVKDGETDFSRIFKQAKELAEKDLLAMIGFSDDDMADIAGKQAALKKKIFITPGATSPLLPLRDDYLFLVAFGDNAQAAAIAQYASNQLGLKTAAILYDGEMEYAHMLAAYFKVSFNKIGGSIVSEQIFNSKTDDFTPLFQNISDGSPQMLFLAAGPERMQEMISGLREKGIQLPIFGGDSFDTPLFTSTAFSDVYFTTHVFLDPLDPRVTAFWNRYKEKYGVPPENAFAALGFDAGNLLLDAQKRAQDGDVFKALIETKSFQGVTGEISYLNGSRVPIKPVTIVSIKNGQRTKAAEFIPANVPPAEISSE